MKHLLPLIVAFNLMTVSSAHAADWTVDGDHAFAQFRVMHLGIAPAFGSFLKIGGSLSMDAGDIGATKLELRLDASSVFTGNKKRDDHLKSPDFFDVGQHPSITFSSTSWKAGRTDGTYEVTGDLTIKGKTNSVTATVTQTGMGADPWGRTRIGFTSELTINRLDFGVDYMTNGLGQNVDLLLSVEFVKDR